MIAVGDCKDRYVYELDARNFSYGVFNAELSGFIGIRHKFVDYFLDVETHWDMGAPYGTAKPFKELGKIPDELKCQDSLGLVDEETGKEIVWNQGRYVFSVDGRESTSESKIIPSRLYNQPLETWLKKTAEEKGWIR